MKVKIEVKKIKTKLNPKIIKLAKRFNIQFRVGDSLKSCKITLSKKKFPEDVPAAYFGNGVIFVRSETIYCKEDMDVICLHEIGHAVLDLFPLTKKYYDPLAEVSANMVALSFVAQLRLPISHSVLLNFNSWNKQTLKRISKK